MCGKTSGNRENVYIQKIRFFSVVVMYADEGGIDDDEFHGRSEKQQFDAIID
jgi:hypothetical protein